MVNTAFRTHSLFREVNERIVEVGPADRDPLVLIGECIRDDCVSRLSIGAAEYRALRQRDDPFVICPGHDADPFNSVVMNTDAYAVVRVAMPEVARAR